MEIDGALRSATQHVTLLHGLDLVWIGGDESGFGRAGGYLDVDVALSGEEQPLTHGELAEALFLLAGEFEHITQYIYGGSRLLEQYLHLHAARNAPSGTTGLGLEVPLKGLREQKEHW